MKATFEIDTKDGEIVDQLETLEAITALVEGWAIHWNLQSHEEIYKLIFNCNLKLNRIISEAKK